MIRHAKMYALVNQLADVKSRQDINGALDIYHPQVQLITPSLNAQSVGAEQARQQLEIFFNVFPDYSVTLHEHAFNDNLMLATGEVTLTPTLTPPISQKQFPTVTVPVFIEFHFKDEKIVKEVFNLDIEHIFKKSGLTAQELYINNQQFINAKKAQASHA